MGRGLSVGKRNDPELVKKNAACYRSSFEGTVEVNGERGIRRQILYHIESSSGFEGPNSLSSSDSTAKEKIVCNAPDRIFC